MLLLFDGVDVAAVAAVAAAAVALEELAATAVDSKVCEGCNSQTYQEKTTCTKTHRQSHKHRQQACLQPNNLFIQVPTTCWPRT